MCFQAFLWRKDFAAIQILFIYGNCGRMDRKTDGRHGSSHKTLLVNKLYINNFKMKHVIFGFLLFKLDLAHLWQYEAHVFLG